MVEVTKIGNKTLVMDGKILSLFRRGSLLRQMYYGGYEDFDGANGGVWKKYINIPIKTVPLEYAQYLIEIDDTNVSVYNVEGTLKAQSSIASEFWNLVRSDGFDIRVFDHLFRQLWFWVEEFDYTNKKAKIWVRLPENSEELNIAFGNEKAYESVYNSSDNVFELFDNFEGTELDTSKWQIAKSTVTVSNGIIIFSGVGASIRSLRTFDDAIIEIKIKITSTAQYDHGIIAYRGDENLDIGSGTEAGNGYTVWYKSNYYPESVGLAKFVNGKIIWIAQGTSKVDTTQWHIVRVGFIGYNHKAWLDGNLEFDTTDTEFASGYIQIGNRRYGETHVDWVRICKYSDPATFDTPRILEF